MKYKNKIISALALSAGLVFSAQSVAATLWKVAAGDNEGSAQHAFGMTFKEALKSGSGGK